MRCLESSQRGVALGRGRAAAPFRRVHSSVRLGVVRVATDDAALPGPQGAFVPGQEAEARQGIFNRIAPVYDEVRMLYGKNQKEVETRNPRESAGLDAHGPHHRASNTAQAPSPLQLLSRALCP